MENSFMTSSNPLNSAMMVIISDGGGGGLLCSFISPTLGEALLRKRNWEMARNYAEWCKSSRKMGKPCI